MRSRVQGLFHPPCGVLFTFPSRYLCAIGRVSSLALEGGPPGFPQDFPCPVVLRISASPPPVFPYGIVTLSDAAFQPLRVDLGMGSMAGPSTPARSFRPCPVWALPRSLATTQGISFDFCSSGY